MDAEARLEALRGAFAQHRRGNLAGAEAVYRSVLAADPSNVDALHLLGVLLHQSGRSSEAFDLIARAATLSPLEPVIQSNFGEVCRATGRIDQAIVAFRAALARDEQSPQTWHNLALALQSAGRSAEAVDAAEHAIQHRPDHADTWNTLGAALLELDRPNEAVTALERAIQLDPYLLVAHLNLGHLLFNGGRLMLARRVLQRAVSIDPSSAEAFGSLGNVLSRAGQVGPAIAALRRAVELDPTSPSRGSALLFTLLYSADASPEAVAAEHRAWGARFAAPLTAAGHKHDNPTAPRDPMRRLRIGYVSPNFVSHPIAFFFESILKHHDRTAVEACCYSDADRADDVTDRLRAAADRWQDVRSLTDQQLADQVHADGIDILVDLAGHMAHNRLLAFARKPAPVQVGYLAYPATTGVPAIDYRLSDPHLDPADQPACANEVEQIYPLATSYYCYTPPARSPDIAPLPARAAGHVTFVSANALIKLNPHVIEAWSRILTRRPEARLLIQAGGIGEPELDQELRASFASHGVAGARIELLPFQPFEQFLDTLNRADIALDPFPFSSGTTTCHLLWMGLPVITLTGRTGVSRMAASVLTNCGLQELIRSDLDGYISLAIELAGDMDRLDSLRSGMRDRLRSSPLLDARSLAHDLEGAFRDMWAQFCNGA